MTTETQHYGLTKLGPSEGLHAGSGRFPSADRDVIDQALYRAVQHHHTGSAAVSNAPELAPDLNLVTSGGTIPAGTTVHYCYTYTDPTSGETVPSPVSLVTTPAPLAAPVAPTAAIDTVNGALTPGNYYYVLSHYVGSSTVETKALNPIMVEVPPGTSTNMITLTLPAAVAGADGFNVYRRSPNESRYYHLSSVPNTATEFVDDGSGLFDFGIEYDGGLGGTGSRSLPSENTTNSANSVEVSIPGATPTIPAGSTWTIYRSYSTSFTNSYLVNLDELTLTYTDVGAGTAVGGPPSVVLDNNPSKIVLTDGEEVQGVLPLDNGGTGGGTAADARTNLDTYSKAEVDAADALLIPLTQKGAVSGVATLDGSGVIPTAQLPPLSLTDVSVVADIVARDALTVEEGDAAIVLDASADPEVTAGGATYLYDGAAWQRLLTPGGGATNLAWDAATSTVTSDTGADATVTVVDATNPGLMTVADKSSLDDLVANRGYHGIVDHGAVADVARPAVGNVPLLWRGTVEPTNALDEYDDWLDYS